MDDLISRQAAIDAIKTWGLIDGLSEGQAIEILADEEKLPTAQPEILACGKGELNVPGTNVGDMISRQAAIDVLHGYFDGMLETDTVCPKDLYNSFEIIPSAQPERTCVNCGRTVNNGGWYADGRTRCPIEEHYALPKDGFCHLWEKRNVTDDDYPERQEVDGERRTDE